MSWITSHAPPSGTALNHCELAAGGFDPARRRWHLLLRDQLTGAQAEVQTKAVVNCAGIWVDGLNRHFNIDSPWKHALSKGVYLVLPRGQAHELPLIFDMGEHDDVQTYVPWGPAALWGPTETLLEDHQRDSHPTLEDVRFLLQHANRHLRRPVTAGDILSLRCGIRLLVAPRDFWPALFPRTFTTRRHLSRSPASLDFGLRRQADRLPPPGPGHHQND